MIFPLGPLLHNTAAMAGPTAPSGLIWDITSGGGNITFSNGSLTAAQTGAGSGLARGLVGTGYFVATVDTIGGATFFRIGIGIPSTTSLGADGFSLGYDAGGPIISGGSTVATGATYTTGDQIKVLWDAVTAGGTVTFYKWNGSSFVQQATFTGVALGATVTPMFQANSGSTGQVTLTDNAHWS